jgi:choline dehydrogenase-like flavoprotein
MKKVPFVLLSLLASLVSGQSASDLPVNRDYDIIVFGATSAGVTAAVAAGRAGEKVLLLEAGYLVGGMMPGGLTKTDIGKRETIGGLSEEFFNRVRDHNQKAYGETSEQAKAAGAALIFEPKVAGIVFAQMLAGAGVTVRTHEQLVKSHVSGGVIQKIVTRDYRTGEKAAYAAPVFIDGTYEGDLMAASDVLYRVGREARSEYNETLAGITKGPAGYLGKSDHRLQSYNIRGTLTNRDDIRVPVPKPEHYDPAPHEHYLRTVLEHGIKEFTVLFDDYQRWGMINGKCDPNKADLPGINMAYPESDYEARARIVRRVQDHWLSLWWMLQNDPRLPDDFKTSARRWGLPSDEYLESGHVTPQLYIRVARRMMGRYFLTQRDCEYDRFKPDAICMGSYNMDSHPAQHIWTGDGRVEEGHFNQSTDPYEIPYRAITPHGVKNLLVVAAISASHVAYSSLRMEPVFMMLGEAGGAAAHLARRANGNVQDVSVEKLQAALKKSGVPLAAPYRPVAGIRVKTPAPHAPGQTIELEAIDEVAREPLTRLSWNFDGSGAVQATGRHVKWTIPRAGAYHIMLIAQDARHTALPADALIHAGGTETPAAIEVHYEQARLKGRWKRTRGTDIEYRRRVGLVDEAEGDGTCSARFAARLPRAGRYLVAVAWPVSGNRATNVPVTITHAAGETRHTINQRKRKDGPFTFVPLGEYEFAAGADAAVTITNAGAKGYVAIDAVRFIPVEKTEKPEKTQGGAP